MVDFGEYARNRNIALRWWGERLILSGGGEGRGVDKDSRAGRLVGRWCEKLEYARNSKIRGDHDRRTRNDVQTEPTIGDVAA